MRSFCRSLLIQVLIALIAFPPAAFAEVIPDAAAQPGKRPTVDKAANGVPLVNITAPSASGLSHNQYKQFDVDSRGLILNNSERAVGTQLGGIIGGNPNLGGKAPAKTILNEVTGANRSHIEGYIEVGGQKADVILANPYGVTVNGGGFINVDRATITTGRPEMNGDKLLLRVEGGGVRIDGAGINASNITGFDVVSRAAEINAQVHANDLSVTTGRNSYDSTTRQATPLTPDGSPAPTVAIDSSALGGMYAGRITLTSTEKGVGVNLDGVVQSVGDLEITADGKLAVKAAQAGGGMKLEAKGSALEVKKAVVAEGSLSAKADRIDIHSEAVLAAGLDLRLEAAQVLNLDREAWAVGGRGAEVTTESLTLAENAALEGGSLRIEATSLTVDKASLAGAGNLEIYGDSVSLRESSLAAGNVLWLDLDDSLTLDAGSAALGYGGVRVRAAYLENLGLIYSGGAAELRIADSLKNLGGADVLAQGDILITGVGANERAALVRNEQSGIESLGGSIRLDADLFENHGGSTATHEVSDGMDYRAIGTNLGAGERMSKRSHLDTKMPNEIWAYMAEQAGLHGTPAQGYKKTEGMQEWVYRSHDVMDEQPIPAALIAAGDVVINAGEVRNILSVISAGSDLFITADRLVNQGVDLFTHRRTDRWIVSTYWKSGSGWSGGSGRIEGQWFNYHAAETYDTAISLITAGRNVVLNLVAQEGDLIIGDEGGFVGRSHGTPAFSDYAVSGVGDGGSYAGGLGGLRLPGLGGLFVLSGDPNHPYLIETNPLLTSFGHFYGSDYFLSRMGLNLDRLQAKLLGDAFYESRLIREQITAMAGVRYLFSGVTDDAETIRQLMDNAVEAGQALDLSVGVALTPEQVARLDKDIVWLEEIDYNGQKALVPRLYLSDATRSGLALRGGTISGETVVVQGRGTLATGQIVGNTVQILSTQDILNRGGDIFGKNSLVVASDGSVVNQSGTLRGGDVLVSAGQDVINETLIERRDEGDTWWSESQQQGRIAATGDLRLEAGRDIRFVGGRAEAGGTAALVAGNDVNLDSKAVEFGHARKDDTASLIGRAGSYVSGKDVGIQAGRDVTLSGSHVAAEANAQLVAGRDLTLLSTQGESHMYSKNTSSGGFGRKSTEILQRDETKVLGSSVTAGNDVTLKAGENLLLDASRAGAANNLTAVAGGSLLLSSGADTLRDEYFESHTGLGGLSGRSLAEGSFRETNVAAQLVAGNNLTTVSGGDTVVTGSYLGAGNDLATFTGYAVRNDGTLVKSGTPGSFVASGASEHYSSYREEKKHTFGGFDISFSGGKMFAGVTFEKTRERNDREGDSVAPSVLEAGNDLRVNAADNIIIEGSQGFAGNDLTLDAEGALSIIDMAAVETTRHLKEKTTIKVGIQVGNAYVDAVQAIIDTVDACKDVADAAKELARMERLHREGKATAQAVEDARIALAMTTVSAGTAGMNAASAMSNAATTAGLGAAAAAGTGMGSGFYASVGMSAETKKTETNTFASDSVASELTAGRNIDLRSGAGTHQRGSYVVSENGNITYRTEGDLLLEAGKSTYSGKTTESTHTASAFFGTNGGGSMSAGTSKSKDSWSGTTWSNSGAYAERGTVRFDVAGDMRAEGFNALGRHIVADVGGDLDLISRQNTSYSSGSSFGVNAGFGFGAPDPKNPNAPVSKNVSGGINQGKSNGDRAWADSTSSLVGTESVDIAVGGNLGLSGSVIANITDGGADGGNLRISAASLRFNDLHNHDEYENRGYGFSTSTGHSLPENAPPSGTTSISLTNQGRETEGVTRSTIGRGTITLAGLNTDPAGLNRDLSKIDEITSDKITGALDATMNIDNRVFSAAGWASIVSDVENFGMNVVAAAEGAGRGTVNSLVAVGAILGSLGGSGEGDERVGAVDTAGRRVAAMQTSNELMNTSEEFRLMLSGQGLTTEQRQRLEPDLQATAAQYGLTVEQFIFYLREDLSGGQYNPGDPAKGVPGSTVGVNMVGEDGKLITGVEALERIFHEYGHPAYGPGKESAAASLGSFASWYGENILSFLYGVDPTRQTQTVEGYKRDYMDASLTRNNDLARMMVDSDKTENYSVMFASRGQMSLEMLDHALVSGYITPEQYSQHISEMLAQQEVGLRVQKDVLGEYADGIALLARTISNPTTSEAFAFFDGLADSVGKGASDFNYMMRHGTLFESLIAKYDGYVERLASDDPYTRERATFEGALFFSTTFSGFGVGGKLLSPVGTTTAKVGVEAGSAAALSAAEKAGAKATITSAEAWQSYGGFPAWSGVDDLSAANRIAHEAYKDILRAQMSKPIVANVELQNILDELYRANAKIGSGSSAAALRYEKVTGMSVSGKFHEIKVMDKSRELTKWLKNNPTASAGDRAAAENVLRDMSNALKGR